MGGLFYNEAFFAVLGRFKCLDNLTNIFYPVPEPKIKDILCLTPNLLCPCTTSWLIF